MELSAQHERQSQHEQVDHADPDDTGQSRSTTYAVPHEGECVTCHQLDGAAVPVGPTLLNLNRDVITSAGYRIGPGEIEDCLLKHPAVALAAAVGIPDELRGERIKAFIVLDAGIQPSAALASEIQAFVKVRLAAHEYPREVAFLDSLPMTATGKIMRRELRRRDETGARA